GNLIYDDGFLKIMKHSDRLVRFINTTEHPYNVQPMWKNIRTVLKAMPEGVYTDPVEPDTPFRTMMIDGDGLQSRIKIPGRAAIAFEYQCALTEISRVAILGLGDRCAVRMLLHKMEYDGPAYPFDLTRTTNLSDVADMIEQGFDGMWNPKHLRYVHNERRIYHTQWTELSFAHEVEKKDDPQTDMTPIYQRMEKRYRGRAERFWYTIDHCDEVLFIRTGPANRGQVIDLMHKLNYRCQGKPFRLLIMSHQNSREFENLPNVIHRNLYFNPDQMYDDLGYWLHCTHLMRSLLVELGITSKNLYWCPPKVG
ncbi:MAG: lipase, partial [Synechococcaceae cyanobacterium RL_1_2]|nr:lipase [Synechococcaceae cyanobacterium RL_1_2]